MRLWESSPHIFPYSFEQVVAAFWDRYPNSKAQHILSEDVIERKIEGNQITTRKLIVKKGATFMKSAPRWMARLTNIQIVPTLEESVYDRSTRTLTTYTRNISWTSLFHMHERCVYKPAENQRDHPWTALPRTNLERAVWVDVSYGRINSLIERVLVMSFRKSVKKTVLGLTEKLEERFGVPLVAPHVRSSTVNLSSQKAALMTEKIFANKKIGFEKA
ncbi:PRELI domain-containing protein 1, mitochondrial [Toxocara canis]|uniref:PRELI domain-containing protein 1, mitochondrial n=1 Tax=Toxocara canis TaxID=6265 RepID=A0A0B2W4I0_TOXCA|nr:PRELI domain-containing protein 1, mitochondrial [Toxocara canis]